MEFKGSPLQGVSSMSIGINRNIMEFKVKYKILSSRQSKELIET